MFRAGLTLQKFSHMTIIGSGQMGAGIAQVTAQSGINVTMVDLNQQALDKAVKSIDKSVSRVVNKKFKDDAEAGAAFKDSILSKISVNTDVAVAAADSDLVCEAIVENLQVKRTLFKSLDEVCPAKTIFATNTSSLSVKEIAESVSDARKSQFGGLHFFNPVPMMKLLEVVRVQGMTSDNTFQALLDYGTDIKKSVVKCEDTPGFLVNRLLVPYLFEAIRLHERGHGSIQDIDTAMKLGAGHPMGPFQLSDYVGLDTCKAIVDGWRENDPDNALFVESPMLNELVANGHHGMKTGKGFYDYSKK